WQRRRPIQSESPGRTAIPGVTDRAVVCPSRMLWRRVKRDIAQAWRKARKHNFEGLYGTIQVHVKDCVLVMPHSESWARYLVNYKEDPIVAGIRLNLLYCGPRTCPRLDSRFHSRRRTDG